jgi:hypothetical protein
MARATHRLIWGGSDTQSRTFHLSRIFAAIRTAAALLREMRAIRPGVYQVDAAIVLQAKHAVDRATPYLEVDE